MKKYVAMALMVASCLATAKGAGESGSSVISFATTPRVLTFDWNRNAIGRDGQMLVCLPESKVPSADVCVDANGRNAWSFAEDALRGYTLTAYEYRFTGSGYRTLILYFGK